MASKFGGMPVTGSRFGGIPVTGSRPVVIPEEEDDRTLGDSVNDFVANFGVGSGQIVGLLGSAYGLATGDMENRLTQTGARTSKFWEERRTPAYLEAERSRQAKIDATEGEFKKAGVAMWETVTNPMLLVGELAKQAPNLALGGVGGSIAKVATGSTRAGTVAATGTGVGLSSADFGQSAYEQLMSLPDEVWLANPQVQERIGDNMDLLPQVKREIATGLAQNSAIAGGLVTYGLNKLPGAKTIEKALGGEALTGTRLRRAAAGLAGETLSEGLEEGATQLTANIAQSQIDPNTRLSTGVGQSAGLGAVTGGGLGLITGALTPDRKAVEDEVLKFGNPPPAPAEVSPEQATTFARTRLEELIAKGKGTAATEIVDPTTGQTVISPGRPAEFLSDNERTELEFLVNNVSNLEAIGTAYNLKVKVAAEQRLNEATSAADAVQAASDMVDTDIEALEREAGIGTTTAPVASAVAPVTTVPEVSTTVPEVSTAAPQGQGLLAQAMAPTLTLETLTQADISTMPAPERQEFLDDLTAARTANLPVQREQALRRAAETYGRTVGPVQQALPSVTPQEAIARAQDLPQERTRTAAPSLDTLMSADTRGMEAQDREDFNANLAMARGAQPGPVQTAALQRAAEVYGRTVGPVQTRAPAAQTTAPRVEVPRPTKLLGKAVELYSETDLETLISNNTVPAITRRGAEVELRARQVPQIQESTTDENFISIPETVSNVAVQPVAGQSAGDAARATAQRAMDTWAASQGTNSPVAFNAASPELEASVAEITDLIGSQWGGRVVAFSDPRPGAINGVAIGKVAYVNVSDNQAGVQRTALHEFKHTVEQIAKAETAAGMTDTPAQEFVEQIDSVFDDITEEGKRAYLENFIAVDELSALEGDARETRMQELLQDPELRSEMVADFLGNRATDKKFWKDLAKADPTGFESFVKRWLAAIDNLLVTLRGAKNRSKTESAKVDTYIRDLNKAKMVAQSALINYRKASGQAPAAPAQDSAPAFSRTQPLVDTSSLDAASKLARSQDWQRGRDFKVALQRQVLDAGMAEGLDTTQDTPKTRRYLLEVGLRDAIAALKQNANAIGWYDTKTRQALAVMSLVHPEIARDENARFAFTWALAVTSNGLKVGKNFELAERAYSEYKRTGVMPNNVGVGTAGSKINDALDLFNTLRNEWGMDSLRNFMQTNFTVSEISGISKALKPSGEHSEVIVKGAAILGPKIGNGFFSNLYGNFDSLTMDRWLIRTWGRWTGTLIKAMPEQTAKARARLQNTVRLVLADPAEAKRLSALLGEEITDDVNALAGAVQIASMDPKIRSALNKTEVGQELRKAGNSLAKYLDGQKEAPQNPDERKYIRAVFGDILDDLRQTDAYKDLTMADLQAVLWYAEKRLYETAKEDPQGLETDEDVEGYADDSAPDYANAAASVAREKGITDRRINAALKRVEDERSGRARPAAASSDTQGQAVGAGEQAAPGGFTRQERRKFIGERAVLRSRANRAGDAQQSGAYAGDGGANGGRVRLLKTLGVTYTQTWKAGRDLGTVFRANDLATPEFFELASTLENATKFRQAVSENKETLKFGAEVNVYPAEDYQAMRMFLTKDGKSGVAIKLDGDIVSVFSTGGAGRAIMELAVSAGGRKLDAFDTILPEFYAPHGFRAVARTKWSDEFAPTEWDKDTFRPFNNGEPDVVFMVYDPSKTDAEYSSKDGRVLNDYDRAVALQNREMERLTPKFSRKQGDVLARDPRLEQAAQGMKEGTVTSAEYSELVDAIKPVTPYTEVPEPAKPADIRRALTSDKLDRIGVPSKTLKAGDPVGLRLDIPAYANHGVWVVSVHDQIPGFAAGKSIGYESVASVTNPTFGVVESAALNIASGKPKATIAVMKGDWKPITPKQAAAAAETAMGSADWVQVGMDPTRHAYFYDRATREPVVSADEAIQVGPLVLAKNPVYGNKEDFRFSRSQRGINVRNDGDNLYADLIVDGEKTMESRNTNSLRAYVGQTVGIIRTGEGPARLIGSVKIGEPIKVDEQEFRELEPEHLVPEGSAFDIKPGSTKFLYPLTEAQRFDEESAVDSRGIVARDVAFSRSQTDTPAFKRWFGDSKVVDKNGQPLVVYHGTTADFNAFDPIETTANSFFGRAFYFTSSESEAQSEYSTGKEGSPRKPRGSNATVIPAYLKMENPVVISLKGGTLFKESDGTLQSAIDAFSKVVAARSTDKDVLSGAQYMRGRFLKEAKRGELSAFDFADLVARQIGLDTVLIGERGGVNEKMDYLRETFQSLGFDGIVDRAAGKRFGQGEATHYAVFDPTQIKSATGNTGAFDPAEPDIRFSRAQKSPLKLYSALARAAENGPGKGQAQQWKGFLRNQKGVTPEEIEWSGVEDWLDTQTGAITREQIGTFLAENGVQVGEVVLGNSGEVYPDDFWRSRFNGNEMSYDDWVEELKESGEDQYEAFSLSLVPIGGLPRGVDGDAKYEKYTVPGGENYREILLTLPTASVPGVAGEITFPDEDSVDDFLTELSAEGFESLDYGATEDEAGDRKVVVFEGLAKNERPEFDSLAREYGGTVKHTDGSSPAPLYRSSHWREGNVLAHIRLKDRLDDEGNEVLFVEELQSDWAQEGRKQGFGSKEALRARQQQMRVAQVGTDQQFTDRNGRTFSWGVFEGNALVDGTYQTEDEALERLEARDPRAIAETVGGISPAPFVQTTGGWLNLALKRVIAIAVEQGYDKVAFVNGEQSAEHYDLAKQVSSIEFENFPGDSFTPGTLSVFDLDGEMLWSVSGRVESPEALEKLIGKEAARKLLDSKPRLESVYQYRKLTGEGLSVGGEGMKAFYDSIVPKTLNKLLPKIGGTKIETVETNLPILNPRPYKSSYEIMTEMGIPYEEQYAYWRGLGRRETDRLFEASRAKESFKKMSSMGFSITPEMRDQVMDAGLPMFSRAQNIFGNPMPAASWQVEDSVLDREVIYHLQDKFVDTKRVVEAINSAVGQIEDKWDPYLQEKMYHGVVAKQTKDFAEKDLKPLIETMGRNKVTLEDFDKYLHNRHAQERNIAIAQRNPALPDAGSGISTADAQAYLAALPPARRVLLEGLARRIDNITKGTRDLLIASGLEAQSTIDAWDSAYKKYVPLMREELDYEGSSGAGTGRGFSVRGSASRRAVGSADRTVVDIMANIAMQRERAIVRAAKNKVSQGLYGLALKNPSPGFWLPINPDAIKDPQALAAELINFGVDPLDAQNIAEEPKESYVDPRTGLVSTRVNRRLRNLPNVVYTRVNGKDRFLVFNPKAPRAERMVTAINNLDADSLNRALSIAAVGTRWFASVNTQYNPIFGIINLSRDLGAGALNLTTTPLADKKAEVIANSIPALRAIYRSVRGKSSQNQWASLWEEFQQVGGQTGFRDQFSQSEERARALQGELNNLSAGNLKKAGQATLSWLSDYNTAMENAVRLSAYKSALDKGMTKQRAAELAKDLTVNFNKKGAIATNMGALFAFFNASVQGTARLAQTLKGPAGKKIVYGGLLLGAVQAVALMAAGFEDDEPPGFIKERNLVIPIGDGKYLTWPMPLGFNVIPNVGRIATEWALSGFERTPDRAIEMATSFFDMFNPIGNAGMSMQTILPTVFDPLGALAQNKDWTGTPISREDLNSLAPTPGYLRARDSASWFATELARFFNLASGGTDFTPGKFSPTPEQLEYLGGQITGGVGRETGKVVKTAELLATGEDLPPYAIPLAGRLYGENTGSAAESNRFYENIRQMNLHNNELRGLRETQQPVEQYLRDNPDARLGTQAKSVYRQVQNMRKRKREMLDRNVSRESIRLIEQQITNRMQQFNDRVSRIES